MRVQSPCKECKERHMACHDKCEKFIKYREDKDEHFNKVFEAKKNDKIMDSYYVKLFSKRKR